MSQKSTFCFLEVRVETRGKSKRGLPGGLAVGRALVGAHLRATGGSSLLVGSVCAHCALFRGLCLKTSAPQHPAPHPVPQHASCPKVPRWGLPHAADMEAE